ncbi:MAG TPA: glycosyltransferase [Candidatus Sulfotelmatobacter sp.]|nr:glycosyltransferase [Candidatus Sulfotelmatobacter sp.]
MNSVDVIVPCYRYGRYLEECVTSVLTQSIKDVRVLIINDASPDNTAEVARKLQTQDRRVSYREHKHNVGHITTYNEGIDWVTSKYLLLLSADDYLLPGSLEAAISLMERNSEVGFTFGNALEIDEQGGQVLTNCIRCRNSERVLTGLEFISISGSRNIVPTPTALVRAQLQKRVGGYRKELPHAGDMELWLRLAAHSSVGFIKPPLAVYRRHSHNMSLSYGGQKLLADLEQRRAALDCFLESCGNLLKGSKRLHRTSLRRLSIDALSCASAAFNRGELSLVQQLAEFARETSPRSMNSWVSAKLRLKRRFGLRAWQILRSLSSTGNLPATLECQMKAPQQQ